MKWLPAPVCCVAQAEEALAELVALGLVASDSFSGLRTLLVPSDRRAAGAADAAGAAPSLTVWMTQAAGRWPGGRQSGWSGTGTVGSTEAVEHAARTLLLRYGVVFWRAIEREADWLPPWRDLLRVYRRLEARGEIRGGRFVAGFSGEQFALPDAIGLLRETRRRNGSGDWVSLSGADPLNLAGILTPGAKARGADRQPSAVPGWLPIAALAGGEVGSTRRWTRRPSGRSARRCCAATTPPVMGDLSSAVG